MRLYFFLFFISFYLNSYAQDLIVTNVGDSISCEIVERNEGLVRFTYKKYNHDVVRELTTSRIKSIIPGFFVVNDSTDSDFSETEILADTILSVNTLKIPDFGVLSDTLPIPDTIKTVIISDTITAGDVAKQALPKWRFGINGGYAYQLFRPDIKSTPYQLRYINELKSGYSFGVDAFYFLWDKVGFGLKYNVFKSRAERDIRTKDDVTIQFFGPSVAHRLTFPNDRTSLISAFWVGYQPYHNKARFIGQDYTEKAKTMGWGVSISLDHKIAKSLALSFAASCYIGSAYKFKKEIKGKTSLVDLPEGQFKDLSRAEFTVGLRFLK